jgi:ectoine hydroxylase-related dioxygenase (phytanoyl-CoA dioxygenase family)
VWDLATAPAILDCVEPLVGPDILLFGSRFFCKYGPDTSHRVSWHQDLDSWGLEPPVAVTVWYAIDRSDEENGCMQVIPGSHRGAPLRKHRTGADEGNMLGRGQHLRLDGQEVASARPVVLDPGEISIHDGALMHASMPNATDRRRCGLAIRYVPCHVRQRADLAKSPLSAAILVRGQDRQRHFGRHPRPFA